MMRNMYACLNPFNYWANYCTNSDDVYKIQGNFDKAIDTVSTVGQIMLQVAQQLSDKGTEFTKKQVQKSMEYSKESSDKPTIALEKQAGFVNAAMVDYHNHFREILEIGIKCNASLMDVYLDKIVPAEAECSKPATKSANQK